MLSAEQRLQLQQLRLLEWSEVRARRDVEPSAEMAPNDVDGTLPARWSLTGGVALRPWQREASDAWFAAGRRGTIKVVTGAGKTLVALAIAERLQGEDPALRMVVVVPTIVLMEQWYETLTRGSNLPASAIGRLGGGHRAEFEDVRILIAVLASARKELPAALDRSGAQAHTLLVIDESHRAGAPEMSAVLDTGRAYSLALSATPERGDEGGLTSGENEVLTRELGDVVFEMSFDDAIRDGILPPFELCHYGLPLDPGEAQRYSTLSRSITDTRRELTAMSPSARRAGAGEGLLTWARRVASRPSGEVAALAARYVNETTRRKQLLYGAESRATAALSLVREALSRRSDARVILFHESIDGVVDLYERMVSEGLPAVMEHSELSQDLRERSLDLFRSGAAQVVVSARSLIEGFNVPEADLGIVVASSSSPRQRIQSIGRVLRKHRDAAGVQKASRVCVLYVRDTVDEAIYERQDWEQLIGLERNRYFQWDPPDQPIEQEASPRQPIPRESEIDISALNAGDEYPGRYEGAEFTADSHGNVVDPEGRYAVNPQGVPAAVEHVRGGPGRFRLSPRQFAVLVRVPREEPPVGTSERIDAQSPEVDSGPAGQRQDWVTRFAGVLGRPFLFPTEEERIAEEDFDASGLEPGDRYAGPLEPATELRFRQKGGGVVARHVRGGEEYARGPQVEEVLTALRRLVRSGARVSRFHVNRLGHAFWREGGQALFIGALPESIEFPSGPLDLTSAPR